MTTNAFCATGEGGGVDPSCSPSGGEGKHSVKLPKNPKSLNIDTASKALEEMGYKVGEAKSKLHEGAFTTVYDITTPSGEKLTASAKALRKLVYDGVRNESIMEKLVANLAGKTRRESMGGREYLVAPLTLIVPGVLNGSKGPLYYPLETFKKRAGVWNGIPIVVNHPTDRNGKPLSGRNPQVLNSYGIGFLFNETISGKVQAEGWFDIENTRRVDVRILDSLERGDKIELSTGLAVDTNPAEPGSVFNAVLYNDIVGDFTPDHLAVLPDGIGACSLRDGCGVNNEDERITLWNKLGKLLWYDTNGKPDTTVTNESKIKEPDMTKLTTDQRTEIVNGLITNCGCTFKEEDRKTLNEMDDAMLEKCKALAGKVHNSADLEKKLKDQEVVINAAKQGFKAGNQEWSLDDKGQWVQNNATKGYPKKDEEDEEEEKKKGKKMTHNQGQPIKLEDLPTDLQEDIVFARNAKQQRKNELIEKLVANHDKDKKPARREALNKLSLADLEDRIADLPEPVANEQQQQRPSYFGAAVPTTNSSGKDEGPAGGSLGMPVWNWSQEKQEA